MLDLRRMSISAAFLVLPAIAPAQTICQNDGSGIPGNPGYAGVTGSVPGALNCPPNPYRCHQAIPSGAIFTSSPGCDPQVSTCSVAADVPTQFPGNSLNPTAGGLSFVRLIWDNALNQFTGACGASGIAITDDQGLAKLTLGVNCPAAALDPRRYKFELTINTCAGATFCPQPTKVTSVDFLGDSGLCPEAPSEDDCDGPVSCDCCKAVGSPMGGAKASAAGGGGMAGGAGTGPGAQLRYKAGGAGMAGLPGAGAWRADLGMFWSHDYAERLFVDANPAPFSARLHQVTRTAVFVTWGDQNGDGIYESRQPASEYEELESLGGGGWELRKLDGRVVTFDANGRWLSEADRFGNSKTATYSSGKLVRVDFPDQRAEELTYHGSGSGKLATITEIGIDGTTTRTWSYTWTGEDLTRIDLPDGRALEYAYEDGHPGFLSRTTLVIGPDPEDRRVMSAFEYDPWGNVVRLWRGSSDFASGLERWQFSYDDPQLPVEVDVTDPLGDVATYTFDSGRTSRLQKAKLVELAGDCPSCGTGPNSQKSYGDPANPFRPTEIVDGRGITTEMTYDADGQIIERIEAVGTALERTTTFDWHATFPALPTLTELPSTTGSVTDFRRHERAYDGNAALIGETHEGIEAGAPFSLTTVHTPTAEGMTATIDPPGYGTADQTSFTYDPTRGSLLPLTRTDPIVGTTTFGYDAFNRRTSITDPNGVVTETTYDNLDRVLTITQKGATTPADLITEHRYNAFGDLFQTVYPRGNVVEYLYDAAGRLVSSERKPDDSPSSHGDRLLWTLNANGQRTREERQRWTGSAWSTVTRTDWVYSSRCHLDSTTEGISVGDQAKTEYAYDCNGNLEQVWDANHLSGSHPTPTTLYEYDELDRLVLARQPFGGTGGGDVDTTYAYDVQDHLTEVVDGNGTVTSYVFSDRDLMTSEVSEVSGTTLSSYNEHGQLVHQLDARGIAMIRTVDALDRVTAVAYPDSNLDVAYTWDDPLVAFSKGRLTRIEQGGHAIDYRYDRFGRTTQDGELTFTLDANGNREEIVYPDGMVAEMTFDYADRPATLKAAPTGGSQVNIVNSAVYRPYGPISSLALGNSRTETRDFNSHDDPTGVQVGSQLNWDYTVDKVGNPTAIVDALNSANNRTYAYQDYQYFLTTGNGPWGTRIWTYDQIGNRLSETRGALTETYAYQPNAATNASPLLATITSTAGNRTFQFDSTGNETQVATPGGTITRRYDDSGRMDRQSFGGAMSLFAYDGRAFLREAAGQGTSASGIFCDGFEDGTTSQWGTGPGSTCVDTTIRTEPTYASEGLLHSLKNGSQHRNILYFGNRPVALQTGTQIRYLTTDHLGTPILMMDNTGATLWQGGFEPFGLDWNGAQTAGQFLRFPGQWEDAAWSGSDEDQGQIQNAYRWYDSALGQYSVADPIGLAGGLHLFRYAYNSPIAALDPKGLDVRFLCRDIGPYYLSKASTYDKIQTFVARNIFGGKHCFLEVFCRKSGIKPTLISYLGPTRGVQVVQDWPNSQESDSSNYDLDYARAVEHTGYSVNRSQAGPCCKFEDCIVERGLNLMADRYKMEGYNPYIGPNSNSFAHRLIRECGGQLRGMSDAGRNGAYGVESPWNIKLPP